MSDLDVCVSIKNSSIDILSIITALIVLSNEATVYNSLDLNLIQPTVSTTVFYWKSIHCVTDYCTQSGVTFPITAVTVTPILLDCCRTDTAQSHRYNLVDSSKKWYTYHKQGPVIRSIELLKA